MQLQFVKAHSFGNSFIILDDKALRSMAQMKAITKRICNVHTGIGADGVLFVRDSAVADAKMLIINADGSLANMCGNGARCFAQYLVDTGRVREDQLTLETKAGLVEVSLTKDARQLVRSIKLAMGYPKIHTLSGASRDKPRMLVDYPLPILDQTYQITALTIGVPHVLIFVKHIDAKLLQQIGPAIEKHPLFPQGTNVNLVRVQNEKSLEILTHERGVGLSMACGTGATAAAAAALLNHKIMANQVQVHFGLGQVTVERMVDGRLFLTGPAATLICQGTWLSEIYSGGDCLKSKEV